MIARAGGPPAALSLSLSLAGCAEAGAGRAAATASAAGATTTRAASAVAAAAPLGSVEARRAALRFELAERPFPSPLLDAVVGGQPATLIVDTGASHHVVARWLADELSVPLSTAADVGFDHAGRPVQVSRLEHVGFTLSDWGVVDAPTLLVVPVPGILRELGIGGFVAPQTLPDRGRAVVLLLPGALRTTCPTDGFAGMDVLRACVLVVAPDGGVAACAPR